MGALARRDAAGGLHPASVEDLVVLDPDHPGFRDPAYRARRNEIARIALDHVVGDPIPRVAYTDAEHAVWRHVWEKPSPLPVGSACREYLESSARVPLDRRRIPQLADVSAAIQPLTGFRMLPVAGLVSSRAFLSHLADGTFLSTQYI